MYYEFYILGAMMNGPQYGYEIKKNMESLKACTVISNNAVYSVLKKFQNLGATEKYTETTVGKPSRIVYKITDTGRQLFEKMLREFPDDTIFSRDHFFVRLSFFEYLDQPARERLLSVRRAFIMKFIEKNKLQIEDCERQNPTDHHLDIMKFHLNLLTSELEVIEKFEMRVGEPCIFKAVSDRSQTQSQT